MSARSLSLHVAYTEESVPALLDRPDTLSVFSYGPSGDPIADPRHLRVPLAGLAPLVPSEAWTVDGPVTSGVTGALRWSAGGGWRFVAIEVTETQAAGVAAASEQAYDLLLAHVAAGPERHLQRIWNYLGSINDGEGDAERYRLFCEGRARSLTSHAITRYPAATAIGHRGPAGLLQVYALCATRPGTPLENPRQMSAWQYPRQYGPTAPNFARAMQMPNGTLAISGTAAVVGHASRHADDVLAQVDEAFANLQALLERARLSAFDAGSPLKIYVRRPWDVAAVQAVLARHLDPSVPRLLLRGDICRSELLIEIDGWR